jgi:hypothetical protein
MPTSRSTDACGIIAPMRSLDFDPLDETEFEEFCFELLVDLGFVNVDWRTGTGFNASPSDRGRDIVGQAQAYRRGRYRAPGNLVRRLQALQAWSAARGPPGPAGMGARRAAPHGPRDRLQLLVERLQGLLARLREQQPAAVPDQVWERPVLQHPTQDNRDLLSRFLLTGVRTESEILAAKQESGNRGRATEEIYQQALKAAEEVRARYPDVRPVESDFEWGMWNGKLSALRWVLGDEWDFLDT